MDIEQRQTPGRYQDHPRHTLDLNRLTYSDVESLATDQLPFAVLFLPDQEVL